MDTKYIVPFVHSTRDVFAALGLGETRSGDSFTKENLMCHYNLTIIVGLTGTIQGNVVLSMDAQTAKRIVSAMMMGMEVSEIDEMTVSALGELANMVCGQAATGLAEHNLIADITPPAVIHGDRMKSIISQVETRVVEIHSDLGVIELNIGLEL